MELSVKGRYARTAEKFGGAAAAAAEELASDEDCLVVAFLRVSQADALMCHSMAPTLAAAEAEKARQTVKSVLLPQILSTLTRRKAAGTLLPGSCRATEVAWNRALTEHKLRQDGTPAKYACACAVAASLTLGIEVYMSAAAFVLTGLSEVTEDNTPREQQLSLAAFVASALDLMAQPREPPPVIMDGVKIGVMNSTPEQGLALNARLMLVDKRLCSRMDGDAQSLMLDAWRRVERSGAIARHVMGGGVQMPESMDAGFDAAAAEAAVRGLRTCALVGCGAREVHVSQFKRCGACRTVAYCCREHQVADWPSHKAACKAARKASSAVPPEKP